MSGEAFSQVFPPGVDLAVVDVVDVCWQAFLRWFDVEHIFSVLKRTFGWTTPRLRVG